MKKIRIQFQMRKSERKKQKGAPQVQRETKNSKEAIQ